MNKRQQGDIGVAMAVAFYTIRGYTVSIPLSEVRYDLVAEREGQFTRVQCKTTGYKRGKSFIVQVATSGGNQSGAGTIKPMSKNDCDALFVWTSEQETYEFPPEVFDGKKNITLSADKEQYKAG